MYQRLLVSDFNEAWVVRLLMTLRSGKRPPRNRAPGDLRQRLQGTGFVILSEVPDDEIVIGVAGKFWRPDGGRCLDFTAGDFGRFARTGYAKAAWNFKLRKESPIGLSNCLLVGRITIRVKGMTETCKIPATTHQNVAPASQAAIEDSKHTGANVTGCLRSCDGRDRSATLRCWR